MSLEAIIWAFDQELENHADKLVLLAIANYCDSDGTCFPSQRKLALITNMTWKSMHAHVGRLKSVGLLKVEKRFRENGSQTSNRYILPLPNIVRDDDEICTPPPSFREGASPPNREGLYPKDEPKEVEIYKYGEFQNVLLTREEFEKLEKKFGTSLALDYTERLSCWLAQTKKKYRSHYATILNWSRLDASRQSAIVATAKKQEYVRETRTEAIARKRRESTEAVARLLESNRDGSRYGFGTREKGSIHPQPRRPDDGSD